MRPVHAIIYLHFPCKVCPKALEVLNRLKNDFHPFFTFEVRETSRKTIFNRLGKRIAMDYATSTENYQFVKKYSDSEVPLIIVKDQTNRIVGMIIGCDKDGRQLEIDLRKILQSYDLVNLERDLELRGIELKYA